VRAVAKQAQRDVHADLGAAAGEQRALAGQVRALVALAVGERRAGRAEPVVERVDERVVVLADVAAPRVDQLARERALHRGDQRDALGLVVDAHRGAGGGRLGHGPVGGELGLALAGTALALERLVHVRGGVLDRPDVGVVVGQLVQLLEHADRDGQVLGVDPGQLVEGRENVVGRNHRAIVVAERRPSPFGEAGACGPG
jgi:hypothetical protein